MPAHNLVPTFSFLSELSVAPWRPLQMLVRTTEARFRPSRLMPHALTESRAQTAVVDKLAPRTSLTSATILREAGSGRVPTIVLGGMVPNAPEQVFLLRRFLVRSGDVYYVSYPPDGFSLELLCAQLSDLVNELVAAGTPPIIFAVSFGAGVALEWLRRSRAEGIEPLLAGLVLVSPVTCIADMIAPEKVKPTTLIGRALKPLNSAIPPTEAAVEKSRAIFLRMFEAGAQNKAALRSLMTPGETERLRDAVISTIRSTTADGARQRVLALNSMLPPTDYFTPSLLPLTTAPTLVLFAEREDSVLEERAPVLFAFERAPLAYFPEGVVRRVVARPGKAPVQHASLIFHAFEFLPPLQAFYHRVRRAQLAYAA